MSPEYPVLRIGLLILLLCAFSHAQPQTPPPRSTDAVDQSAATTTAPKQPDESTPRPDIQRPSSGVSSLNGELSADSVARIAKEVAAANKQFIAELHVAGKGPTPSPTLSPELVAQLTKELLAANSQILVSNNQAVAQIASTYKDFGGWITLMLAIATVVAGFFGYFFGKNYNERMTALTTEVKEKTSKIEGEMEASKTKLNEVVSAAEKKLKEAVSSAEAHAVSVQDKVVIIDRFLRRVDELESRLAGKFNDAGTPPPTAPAGSASASPPPADAPTAPQPAAVSAEESAKVSQILKDKLPENGGTQ